MGIHPDLCSPWLCMKQVLLIQASSISGQTQARPLHAKGTARMLHMPQIELALRTVEQQVSKS